MGTGHLSGSSEVQVMVCSHLQVTLTWMSYLTSVKVTFPSTESSTVVSLSVWESLRITSTVASQLSAEL